MTTLEAFSDFSRNYLMARCYSQKTVDGYWWVIRSFVESAGNIRTEEITYQTYTAWVEHMQNKGNAKLTIHTNVSNFRVFVDYLHLLGLCELHRDAIKAPKRPRHRQVKFAPKNRVEAMIRASQSLRNRAILAVMFSGAIRNSELRNLKRTDVQDRDVYIRHGKGDEDRVVRLTPVAKTLLDRYIAARMDDSPYLFVTTRGDRIASSTLRYIFKKASADAGVEHTSPHQVRHGGATELMLGGMHLREIQEYLGHAYSSTTEIYTHVLQPQLKKDFDKSMPDLVLTAQAR